MSVTDNDVVGDVPQGTVPPSLPPESVGARERNLLAPYLAVSIVVASGLAAWRGLPGLIYSGIAILILWFPARAYLRKQQQRPLAVRLLVLAVALYIVADLPREIVESLRRGSRALPQSSVGPPGTVTPDNTQLIRSTRYGFTVKVPADWRVRLEPGGKRGAADTALIATSPASPPSMLVIEVEPIDRPVSLDRFVRQDLEATLASNQTGTRIIGTTACSIGGRPAMSVEVEFSGPGEARMQRQVYVATASAVYCVIFNVTTQGSDAFRPTIESILESFLLETPAATGAGVQPRIEGRLAGRESAIRGWR